eukprot:5280-Heterococcus_DN1.PRE.1
MAGGAQGQHANHSVNVVGQLKAELMNTTKEFKCAQQHTMRSYQLQQSSDVIACLCTLACAQAAVHVRSYCSLLMYSDSSTSTLPPTACYWCCCCRRMCCKCAAPNLKSKQSGKTCSLTNRALCH